MFKTVLSNVVCIYHYMGKNKIDSDTDSGCQDNYLKKPILDSNMPYRKRWKRHKYIQ